MPACYGEKGGGEETRVMLKIHKRNEIPFKVANTPTLSAITSGAQSANKPLKGQTPPGKQV